MRFALFLIVILFVFPLLEALNRAPARPARRPAGRPSNKNSRQARRPVECKDIARNCARLRHSCNLTVFRALTQRYCQSTCHVCRPNNTRQNRNKNVRHVQNARSSRAAQIRNARAQKARAARAARAQKARAARASRRG